MVATLRPTSLRERNFRPDPHSYRTGGKGSIAAGRAGKSLMAPNHTTIQASGAAMTVGFSHDFDLG
jgi:hypothetical protein